VLVGVSPSNPVPQRPCCGQAARYAASSRLILILVFIYGPGSEGSAFDVAWSVRCDARQANVGTGKVWATSTIGCAKHLIATEGVKGLFRGFTATASRDGPGMALYYIIYDVAKKVIPGWSDKLDEHTGKPKHTALQVRGCSLCPCVCMPPLPPSPAATLQAM
jgi:hypothetical protein